MGQKWTQAIPAKCFLSRWMENGVNGGHSGLAPEHVVVECSWQRESAVIQFQTMRANTAKE